MIKNFFKSKREKELILEKESLEVKSEILKNEIRKKDGFLKCKNSIIEKKKDEDKKEKNWQEMEEKLRGYHTENSSLKGIIKESEKVIPKLYMRNSYLVPVERYFSEARFKELVEILKKKGSIYVQTLDEFVIENLSIEEKEKLDLKRKLEKFESLDVNWEIKTYLMKGEKISKTYMKRRKFMNFLLSQNKEFMNDIENCDFENLKNEGFQLEEIDILKDIYQKYMEAHKKVNE